MNTKCKSCGCMRHVPTQNCVQVALNKLSLAFPEFSVFAFIYISSQCVSEIYVASFWCFCI